MNIKDLPQGSYTPVKMNINSLPQGSYTPVSASTQTPSTTSSVTLSGGSNEPGLAQTIWNGIVNRGQRMNAILEGREGSTNPVTRAVQAVAQPFGAVLDTASTILTDTLPRSPAFQKLATSIPDKFTVANPDTGAKELFNPLTALMRQASDVQSLQDVFISLEQKNPEVANTIYNLLETAQAGGEIADAIGLTHGLQQGARYLDTKIPQAASATASKVADTYKVATARSEAAIEKNILYQYQKGVKPNLPGKTTSAQQARYKQQVLEGAQTIKSNKEVLQYVDETGEIIKGQTPQTVQQLNDAIAQTKRAVFQKYNTSAKEAGEAGLQIDVNPVAEQLDDIINNASLKLTNPSSIKYAESWKARLQATGKLDPLAAQEVIENLNQSLQAFYSNPTYGTASRAQIDAMIANKMRQLLDEGVNSFTGSGYQTFRNQYAALKAMERDVAKAALRQARQNIKGLIDYADIFSGGQAVNGILSMNAGTFASGVAQKGITEFYKFLNNPNRAITKMFQYVDDLDNAPAVNPVVDYVKNIQPGMSVKDVTKNTSIETLGEQAGGWKPGMKAQFDRALFDKNPTKVKELLPQVPKEYATRFSKKIDDVIGEKVSSVPIRGDKGRFAGRTKAKAVDSAQDIADVQRDRIVTEFNSLKKNNFASVKRNLITQADYIDELEEIMDLIERGVDKPVDLRTAAELLELLKR